jgi:hypothetical protein
MVIDHIDNLDVFLPLLSKHMLSEIKIRIK